MALKSQTSLIKLQGIPPGIMSADGLIVARWAREEFEALIQRLNTMNIGGGPFQPSDADLDAIAALTTTAYGRGLLIQAAASNARTYLGLGSAALEAIGTSGSTVPKLDAANTWSLGQSIPSISELTSVNGGPIGNFKNLLLNPDGRINRRAPATNADNTFGHDRWLALTQTNTIAVSTLSDVENGVPRMWRLTQSQAVAQRMGYAQVVEGANCKHLRGKSATLGGRLRFSLNAPVSYALCEWTGTEDVLGAARDIVNDWTNATLTAGQFFKSTTFNVLATGTLTPAAATLTDLTKITATIGSSANNLVVFMWTGGTAAQNATLDGFLQLEIGTVASQKEIRPASIELDMTERYCETLGSTTGNESYGCGQAASTTRALATFLFKTPKRVAPTVALSAANHWAFVNTVIGAFVAWVTVSSQLSIYGASFDVSGMAASLGGAGTAALWGPNSTASAKMTFDAEIA